MFLQISFSLSQDELDLAAFVLSELNCLGWEELTSAKGALWGRLHPALPVEGATRAPMIDEKNQTDGMTEIKAWFHSGNDVLEKIKKSFPNLKKIDVQEIDPKTIFFKPQSFPPVQLCGNIWIVPSPELSDHSSPFPSGETLQITIRPGSAFGTGRHESTQLVAELISGRDAIHRVSFLDVGTGSGILAILAKKLGASHVDTVENDPQAIINTKENFELNNCEEIKVYSDISDVNHRTNAPSHDRTFPFYDTIIANITAPVLIELKPHFDRLLKPQGHLILSGILAHEIDNLLQKFSNYSPRKQIQKNEWVGLHLVKTH